MSLWAIELDHFSFPFPQKFNFNVRIHNLGVNLKDGHKIPFLRFACLLSCSLHSHVSFQKYLQIYLGLSSGGPCMIQVSPNPVVRKDFSEDTLGQMSATQVPREWWK